MLKFCSHKFWLSCLTCILFILSYAEGNSSIQNWFKIPRFEDVYIIKLYTFFSAHIY